MLRRRLILYLTRSIFTFTVILTLTLAALDVQTHRNPTVFTRNSWDLSASLDRWSTMNVIFFRGYFIVDNVEEIQPAFTGQFMTDVPFSPNRTDPVGIQWQRTDNANQITINRPGLGDSPRPLAHLGLLWKSPTDAPGSFGSNRFRNWWFQINLLFPLLLSTAATILASLAARRASLPFRRLNLSLCPRCGYDLRHSKTRCPECGTST